MTHLSGSSHQSQSLNFSVTWLLGHSVPRSRVFSITRSLTLVTRGLSADENTSLQPKTTGKSGEAARKNFLYRAVSFTVSLNLIKLSDYILTNHSEHLLDCMDWSYVNNWLSITFAGDMTHLAWFQSHSFRRNKIWQSRSAPEVFFFFFAGSQ